jgi:hypothetical protein
VSTTLFEVPGVQGRPGGRVRLRFTPVGVSVTDDTGPGRLARCFARTPMLLGLGVLLLQGWTWFFVMRADPPTATALLSALPGLLVLLYLIAGALYHTGAGGELMGRLLIYALVILLPLLLLLLGFPRARHWLLGRGAEKEAAETPRPRGLVTSMQLDQARVLRRGRYASAVELRLTDGTDVVYSAHGDDGVRMVHGFRLLLGEHLQEDEPRR